MMILVALHFCFQLIATHYFSSLVKMEYQSDSSHHLWFYMKPAATAVHVQRSDYLKPLKRPHALAKLQNWPDMKRIVAGEAASFTRRARRLSHGLVAVSRFVTLSDLHAAVITWCLTPSGRSQPGVRLSFISRRKGGEKKMCFQFGDLSEWTPTDEIARPVFIRKDAVKLQRGQFEVNDSDEWDGRLCNIGLCALLFAQLMFTTLPEQAPPLPATPHGLTATFLSRYAQANLFAARSSSNAPRLLLMCKVIWVLLI